MAKLLLDAGANPNLGSEWKDITPFLVQAQTGNIDMAKLLLQYGAKPCAKNKAGKSAKDIALENGRKKFVKFIEDICPN